MIAATIINRRQPFAPQLNGRGYVQVDRRGRIVLCPTILPGFDKAPQAFRGLFRRVK